MRDDKTLKKKLDALKEEEEKRKRAVNEIQKPESTFKVEAPTAYSDAPKERGKLRSFVEDRILPIVSGSAREIGAMMLTRDITPSEAPRMFAESLKYGAKEEVRSSLENFVNDRILSKVNSKLPFDLTYSSRPMSNPSLRSANTTVDVKKEEEWERRARKLKMMK